MYQDWVANMFVVAGTALAVGACVLLHYGGLLFVSRSLQRLGGPKHMKVLYAIGALMTLHVAEIWIFGLTVWLLLLDPSHGAIGPAATHLFDHVYFSAVTFTTVGFGDVVPQGPIRFLCGMEALTGFVLVAWSASFTYLEMERYWKAQ